jgi:hypothetical protein
MGKKILTMQMSEVDDTFNPIQSTQVTAHFGDDTSWDRMLPFFLHFLEGAGYLGVVETMSELIDGDVYDLNTFVKPVAWETTNE